MPLLRTQVESVLVRRCGKLLALAGLDGTTVDGTNPDLSDPIADALRWLGLTVADPSAVADADLAPLPDDRAGALLAVAELRALESALGNWDSPDEKIAQGEQDWGKFAERLEKTIARKAAEARQLYGYGLAPLSGGVIGLDFAETLDCTEPDWER